jgi:hypothetical protein
MKLVGAGEKCPIAEFCTNLGTPIFKVPLPVFNELTVGIYSSGVPIEEVHNRPGNILCQTGEDNLLVGARKGSPLVARRILIVDVRERLPVVISHDKISCVLLDGPGRRESTVKSIRPSRAEPD